MTYVVKTPPNQGPGIADLQRRLKKRGRYGGKVDGVYGPATGHSVYQTKLLDFGYAKPDTVVGDLFLAYLRGTKKPTAAMLARAKKARAKAGKTPAGATSASTTKKAETAATRDAGMRSKAVHVMQVLLRAEPRVHYRQIRPMTTRSIHTLDELVSQLRSGISCDCSESSTLIARLSGAKDPNGLGYNGQGYTGTILNGPAISKSQLRPGDFVVFGGGTGHHVCVVLAAGSDPLLFSHGQEKGPIPIRLSVEARFQPTPIRYRRLVAA